GQLLLNSGRLPGLLAGHNSKPASPSAKARPCIDTDGASDSRARAAPMAGRHSTERTNDDIGRAARARDPSPHARSSGAPLVNAFTGLTLLEQRGAIRALTVARAGSAMAHVDACLTVPQEERRAATGKDGAAPALLRSAGARREA